MQGRFCLGQRVSVLPTGFQGIVDAITLHRNNTYTYQLADEEGRVFFKCGEDSLEPVTYPNGEWMLWNGQKVQIQGFYNFANNVRVYEIVDKYGEVIGSVLESFLSPIKE